jgi:hypothetical protein
MESNSDKFWEGMKGEIGDARVRAKRNNDWAAGHTMVNTQTGEVTTNKEGNILSLLDLSKSWYNEKGARNNAFAIVRRLKKVLQFECDLQKLRPKLITLTFADVVESWEADRAIQKFIDCVRHWAKRHDVGSFAYFWTSEVQMKTGRGALHYHILLLGLPFLTKEQVRAWWSYGFIDIRAADDTGRAFKYLAKYLWKWGKEAGEPDDLPDWWYLFSVFHKRRYGFSKWFSQPPIERIPGWLKDALQECSGLEFLQKAGRIRGGGWSIVLQRPRGDVELQFDSPFRVVEMAR